MNETFICECGSTEHMFMFRLDDFYDGTPHPDLFLTIHLSPLSLWERLKNGIKYIFGHRCRYGDFQETLLSDDDTERLIKFLQRVQDVKNKIRTTRLSEREGIASSLGATESYSQETSRVSKPSSS